MALIKCPECGSEISDKAFHCPKCGCPISMEKGEEIQMSLNQPDLGKEKVVIVKGNSGCMGCLSDFMWFVFWACVIAGIILGIVVYINKESSSSRSNGYTHYEPPRHYEKTSVTQMRTDLKKNEVKAQDTYYGKYFEIDGLLGNMDSEGAYFYLDEEYWFSPYKIKCKIPQNKKSEITHKLMDMQKAQPIYVKGKVTDMGEIMGYEVTVDDIGGRIKQK